MLRLAYFADDFTGATDALETLAQSGRRTRLFLDPPTPAQCAGLEAVGVAGLTRSLAPDAMDAVLRPAFAALRALNPRHVYYKVCSTFDSSPTVGSIGRAIEVGRAVFGGGVTPVVVAAPALGRYCAFGNLFARYGIGSDGPIYRLDRHPAASRHVVTPMTEADLRLHLAAQTTLRIGLVSLPSIEGDPERVRQAVLAQAGEGADVVLIDALTNAHLDLIGGALGSLASAERPLFSVGSSGLGTALAAYFATIPAKPAAVPPGPVLILSGSCSPVTGGQVDHALAHGFTGVSLDPTSPDTPAIRGQIVGALRSGRPVVAYTARGSGTGTLVGAAELGTALGRLAREAVAATGLRRVVFAGGDTSSYAARALGLQSIEWLAPLAPGAPWCRAYAPGSPVDGLALNFKGGQVGATDYFTHTVNPS